MEQIVKYCLPVIAFAMIWVQHFMMKKIGDFPQAETKKEKNYLLVQKIMLVIISVFLLLRYEPYDAFAEWKIICILGLLFIIAYIDHKIQIIPNEFILAGLILRGIVLLPEVFMDFTSAIRNVLFELIACVVMLIFCLLLRFVSRKGVGMGDVKLLALLPLFLGIVGCFEATLYAMVIMFIQAVICLITRKKNKTDVLPFAPAILGGVILWTICLGI